MWFLISMLLIAVLLTACNLTISVATTNGKAEDVIDDTSTASPDIKTDLSFPKAG